MKSPSGTTAIVFSRFTLFYTIPIVLILLAMKLVFDAPPLASFIAAVWDSFAMTGLFFFLHGITRGRYSETRKKRPPLLIIDMRHVEGDFDSALRRVIETAKGIKGFRFLGEPTADGSLVGITGATINSLGELIRIRPDSNHSTIEVSSRPAFNAGFGDGGKNRRNVETLMRGIGE